MFSVSIIDIPKLVAALIVGGIVAYGPAYLHGKSIARSQIEAEAAKEALNRIQTLEKNNEAFKSLSNRDRCVVFMRDSGLPDSACDG